MQAYIVLFASLAAQHFTHTALHVAQHKLAAVVEYRLEMRCESSHDLRGAGAERRGSAESTDRGLLV